MEHNHDGTAETGGKDSQEPFRQLANIGTPCWLTELDGSCSWLNQQWIKYTGVPLEEQIGFGWVAVVHPDDQERSKSIYLAAVESEEDFELEYRLRRHDGKYRLFRAKGAVRRDGNGAFNGYTGFSIDIHNETEAKKALALEREALIASNEDLEQFAYVASHDLRAPLRGVSQLSEWILEDDTTLSDETKERLELVRGRVCILSTLLDDLLAYSRAGRNWGEPVDVDVHSLLEETIDLLSPDKSFQINVAEGLSPLTTYTSPLTQIFLNLISNAIKHHDKSFGIIDISTKDLGQSIEFTIRDDGPGIEPRFHGRVFEMFQTLKHRAEGDGSGMGLAIVRKTVRRLGGDITLDSQPPDGTTFRFTLPKSPRRIS